MTKLSIHTEIYFGFQLLDSYQSMIHLLKKKFEEYLKIDDMSTIERSRTRERVSSNHDPRYVKYEEFEN